MDSFNTPTLFTHRNRPLHTLWLESQAWFCAHELGRLSGHFYDEHCMRKLVWCFASNAHIFRPSASAARPTLAKMSSAFRCQRKGRGLAL